MNTDDLSPLRDPDLADPIRDLVNLLSQPNRAFLLGAGCSKCAGLPLASELAGRVLGQSGVSEETRTIVKTLAGAFNGPRGATIEDYLSELVDLLSIAERRKFLGATDAAVRLGSGSLNIGAIQAGLDELKSGIAMAINSCTADITTHRHFIRAIHRSLRSGKAGDGKAVDYFVLNYDTLVEDALGFERITVADGFSGAATGWWNEASLDPSNVQARVLKVHGSIDWFLVDDDVLPHRIRPSGDGSSPTRKPAVIWPAATKYRETQRDPYAQILKVLRKTLRPAEKSETVLAVCGYRFADSHINLELEQALRERLRQFCIPYWSVGVMQTTAPGILGLLSSTPTMSTERRFRDISASQQMRAASAFHIGC